MGIIGGYRVVRRLGVGSRAEVWLGRSSDAVPLVALKVYRANSDPLGIDREIGALSRVDSPHVVGLLDTANDDVRPCLIIPRLDAGGLARLLAERPILTLGEVVTLVVPVAQAVAAMHAAGVVHGDLRPGKVLFDGRGAPMVIGGGGIRLLETAPSAAVQRDDPGLGADRQQLAHLAATLLTRADADAGGEQLARLRDRLEGDDWQRPGFADDLADSCFQLADPAPLQLPWHADGGAWSASETQGQDEPPRVVLGLRVGTSSAPHAHAPEGAEPRRHRQALGGSPLAHRMRAARAALRAVRPGFRVLGVLCVVSVLGVVGMSVAQSDADDAPAPIVQSAIPTPSVGASAGSAGASAVDKGVEDDAARTEPHGDDASLTGDDPVAAARSLLAMREACHRDLSIECLGAVVQRNSAAWDADVARIAALRDGSRSASTSWQEDWSVVVVDTMGAVVLLEIGSASGEQVDPGPQTTPASVLIIRTEAGWRIRDVFAG